MTLKTLLLSFLTTCTAHSAVAQTLGGVEYSPKATTFHITTSPDVKKVNVLLSDTDIDSPTELLTKQMKRVGAGKWELTVKSDLKGKYYLFSVYNSAQPDNTPGIFAKAVGVNGKRGAIVDLRDTDPEGWADDVRPALSNPCDLVIYEMHHRDFSVDLSSGLKHKGKYLALTEPKAIEHLQRLGVNAVHILPSFDYASVDESKPDVPQYNWGYDPLNYNVPEGSYSTDAATPTTRIREFKQMVQALHRAGIRIILDVVYNHTFDINGSNFQKTYPDYFYRKTAEGKYSDGSGCGNETASEKPLMREFMKESVEYWIKEYHIDGFRFDLMGLYDVDTMNELRAALDALPGGRSILMYGEPWQGGGSQLHRYEANKANLAMLSERIGVFCDNTRDVIKGGCFDAREPGYVEGKPGSFWDIGGAVAAWCRSDKLPAHSPSQIVSYVSAHDNFTLWDKLMLVRYARPEYTAADSAALAQNRLAAGIYLTCMGMPFLQAGEEFARTKKGQGNTYRSSPSLNRLDWKRAAQFHGLVDYYRGLLGLRAQFPRLSASDTVSPAAIKFFSLEQPLVGWTLPAAPGDGAAWRALCVFYNPTEEEKRVHLPDGQWKLLSDGVSSALWKGPSRVCGGEVTLLPYSATIFGQV